MRRARSFSVVFSAALAGAWGVSACSTNPPPVLVPVPPSSAVASSSAEPPPDALGARPAVADATPYVPPVPEVFDGPGGSKVWLLERHGLPLVSIVAVASRGAADEGAQGGLARVTADMLDEGTDRLDALAFSKALEEIGAQLGASADREKSTVHLSVLSAKLSEGLALMGGAVTHPRFGESDWRRVSSLWVNALKARGDDPSGVARLVTTASLWGRDEPYGHPIEGTLTTAKAIKLADAKRWHQGVWQPENVTFVVVGDVARPRLTTELGKAFASWPKAPREPLAAVTVATPAPAPRVVMVDRPDAPQVVVTVARRSEKASSPELPRLELLNVMLGGSFTSRLNQNLREDHGWTYGARSGFAPLRQGGTFLARAAIRTDALSDALRETLGELRKMAEQGPSDEEVTKARALARADVVETYGSLHAIASQLADHAAQRLPPDQDARTLTAQASASRTDLVPLARQAFQTADATIVMVGPRQPILDALAANKLPAPEERDAEGRPLPATAAKKGK